MAWLSGCGQGTECGYNKRMDKAALTIEQAVNSGRLDDIKAAVAAGCRMDVWLGLHGESGISYKRRLAMAVMEDSLPLPWRWLRGAIARGDDDLIPTAAFLIKAGWAPDTIPAAHSSRKLTGRGSDRSDCSELYRLGAHGNCVDLLVAAQPLAPVRALRKQLMLLGNIPNCLAENPSDATRGVLVKLTKEQGEALAQDLSEVFDELLASGSGAPAQLLTGVGMAIGMMENTGGSHAMDALKRFVVANLDKAPDDTPIFPGYAQRVEANGDWLITQCLARGVLTGIDDKDLIERYLLRAPAQYVEQVMERAIETLEWEHVRGKVMSDILWRAVSSRDEEAARRWVQIVTFHEASPRSALTAVERAGLTGALGKYPQALIVDFFNGKGSGWLAPMDGRLCAVDVVTGRLSKDMKKASLFLDRVASNFPATQAFDRLAVDRNGTSANGAIAANMLAARSTKPSSTLAAAAFDFNKPAMWMGMDVRTLFTNNHKLAPVDAAGDHLLKLAGILSPQRWLTIDRNMAMREDDLGRGLLDWACGVVPINASGGGVYLHDYVEILARQELFDFPVSDAAIGMAIRHPRGGGKVAVPIIRLILARGRQPSCDVVDAIAEAIYCHIDLKQPSFKSVFDQLLRQPEWGDDIAKAMFNWQVVSSFDSRGELPVEVFRHLAQSGVSGGATALSEAIRSADVKQFISAWNKKEEEPDDYGYDDGVTVMCEAVAARERAAALGERPVKAKLGVARRSRG